VQTAQNSERVTNDYNMRNSMHASAVRAVFGLPIPVLHFVADSRTLVRLCINFTVLNFQFFVSKCGNNCTERKINDVQLQNSNLRVWHYANFVYVKLFQTETNSTLMDSTLLNKRAKFGAKIFRHY